MIIKLQKSSPTGNEVPHSQAAFHAKTPLHLPMDTECIHNCKNKRSRCFPAPHTCGAGHKDHCWAGRSRIWHQQPRGSGLRALHHHRSTWPCPCSSKRARHGPPGSPSAFSMPLQPLLCSKRKAVGRPSFSQGTQQMESLSQVHQWLQRGTRPPFSVFSSLVVRGGTAFPSITLPRKDLRKILGDAHS